MLRNMLKAKLHRVRVTEANLNYIGSITIDSQFMEKAGILPDEKVQVVNNNNGARFETYVIPGEPGSKTICLNGAAARLAQPGDEVIIMSYVMLDESEIKNWKPEVIFFDQNNNIVDKTDIYNI
ncbi:MAG: aspartate 1-decarboxylase [Halothermotrichaceae bacterium]